MSPFRCPSLFSILSFLEYEYGVYHPLGGCGTVTQAMARLAEQLGVEFRLNEPVREILFVGRRATGVRTDVGVYRCDSVVMNADFSRGMQRLVPDLLRRRWTDARIAKKKFSCSTFMVYLGVEGTFDLPHHAIHIARDYRAHLEDLVGGSTHPESGLPVIFASARISSRWLLEDLGTSPIPASRRNHALHPTQLNAYETT